MSLGLFHKKLFSYFFLDELTDPVQKKKKQRNIFHTVISNALKCNVFVVMLVFIHQVGLQCLRSSYD